MASVKVVLTLSWEGDCWKLWSDAGPYYTINGDFSNIKDAVKSFVRKDMALLQKSLEDAPKPQEVPG